MYPGTGEQEDDREKGKRRARERRRKKERHREWPDIVTPLSPRSPFSTTLPFCTMPAETRKWKIQPCCLPGCFMKFNKYEMNLPHRARERRRMCVKDGTIG